MAGIYVHVPFCKQKCTYCDFASYPREIQKAEAYFACLYKEIKSRSMELKDKFFDTVYFGGGTPSFVDPKYILGAMRLIKKTFNLSPDLEVTLEVNPGTIDRSKLRIYKEAGINRFSIGLQTADDQMLKKLNRIHTKEDFLKAADVLKGYNLSVDIMLGIFDQGKDKVKESIDLAILGGAKHISAYALKAEEGTPLYSNYLNGDLPDDDTVAELYDFARQYLKENGFEQCVYANTALSAELVLNSNEPIACVCSESCAKLYGLEILSDKIADAYPNYTRFICFSCFEKKHNLLFSWKSYKTKSGYHLICPYSL